MPAAFPGRPADHASPPVFNAPAVVLWLSGITVALHILRILLPDNAQFELLQRFGFIAARYSIDGAYAADPLAYLAGPVGHTLLHAGWGHLFINVAFLAAFGAAIARRMGAAPFLLLYFASGVAGAFFWAWLAPISTVPLVGASGAISGLVGAVGVLSLRAPLAGPLGNRRTAIAFVAVWLGTNLLIGLFDFSIPFDGGDIAWEAHIAGFAAGGLLIQILDGRGVKDRTDRAS